MNGSAEKLPWIEMYRPSNMEEILSHGHIIDSIKIFLKKKSLPHLLFYGPSGTGKTSTILCCSKQLYGSYSTLATLMINASNDRGIDTVRNTVKNFVTSNISLYLPPEMSGLFKLVVLDEIDSMTNDAQGMLRQTIEKYSETTRFCLICNNIDKVNPALQSRCALFRFPALNKKCVSKKLRSICDIRGIEYDLEAISAIVKTSKGDLRASINILQYISSANNNIITSDAIYGLTGTCGPELALSFANILDGRTKKGKEQPISTIIKKAETMAVENNITISDLLNKLSEYIINSDCSDTRKIKIMDKLAKFEIYDASNIDDRISIMNIAALFKYCRDD